MASQTATVARPLSPYSQSRPTVTLAEENQFQPDPPTYFPSGIMERRPVPVSAPKPSIYLDPRKLPAVVVHVRLFIDAKGIVIRVLTISPEDLPATAIDQVETMFLATRFIPGNIHGFDLPSYMDIEIDLTSYVR